MRMLLFHVSALIALGTINTTTINRRRAKIIIVTSLIFLKYS